MPLPKASRRRLCVAVFLWWWQFNDCLLGTLMIIRAIGGDLNSFFSNHKSNVFLMKWDERWRAKISAALCITDYEVIANLTSLNLTSFALHSLQLTCRMLWNELRTILMSLKCNFVNYTAYDSLTTVSKVPLSCALTKKFAILRMSSSKKSNGSMWQLRWKLSIESRRLG